MSHHRHQQAHRALAVFAGALLMISACGRRTAGNPTTAAPTTGAATTIAVDTTTAATETTIASSTTLDQATIVAIITANWEKFFQPTTPIDARVALLENGESLRQALVQRAADPLMQQASARVKSVVITAPDRATVTYDVSLNGTVALADSQGTAVLQDGVWKVGAESFCALIGLGATTPLPGCN